ncbi:putative mediator of RNA polymerase II transcription subunit 26 [Condylostylus longicornis]|uniref:putative mediator of RNA polymerase II transcription subunit 26 n=1 Tax=Condylostylus longicornis TaxID=2530218 RepID=UPI00244DD5EB|nr:putative mediator of RNA polymerase II transcription subunit 26 [Condylostylus longicornis]XP_055384903.1 putative mediator of RNA polymerase II transcription subunit 26 [Condylostylus longicornis]
MAYSTVEELKCNVKVLNNKNQSQTDLPNDFITSRYLNVETSQTIPRQVSSSADATYLIKSPTATTTTNIPISTVTTIKENIEFNSKGTLNNITSNLQQIDPPSDLDLLQLFNNKNNNLDNLTNIFDLEENSEQTKNIKMIEKDQDNFDNIMNVEREIMNIDPKNAIPLDTQLSSEFLNIFDDVDMMEFDSTILNNDISTINDSDGYLKKMQYETLPISTASVLVKDEELTTYDCINPNNVHAFPCEIENNITITPPNSIPEDTNCEIKNENYDDLNNFNLIDFINTNTLNNNNGDGNFIANNNIMDSLNSCNNTYRKKKTKALILKTDLRHNNNANLIETPDVIKIVESFETQKEKENMFPVDVFSTKILSDDSCNDSFDDGSRIESPELDVGVQEFDRTVLTYQMSPSDSAISNCTSRNNNIPSPALYENPLSVGGSSITYSDDANLSITTSNFSSPPPTPASQTSQTYSEYSSTQNSECTQIQSKSKKKRGRPALDHSSPPTIEQLRNSDPNKRKYLEQRYKNNEASRISRRNRKRKEEEEKEEELREIRRNAILKAKHAKLTQKHEYLKDKLRMIVAES